jgi:hypothetical protein
MLQWLRNGKDNVDDPEGNFKNLLHLNNKQATNPRKRKSVSLCRHKLQGRTCCKSRSWRQPADQQPRITEFEEEDTDDEWAQLREMEKFLEQQKIKLLRQGASELEDEDWDEPHWPEENESDLDEEKDDSLENEDLNYITSILDSFGQKSKANKLNESSCKIFTPEDVLTRAKTKQLMPQNFNHKFNQNLTIKNSATGIFSYFPTIGEEGPGEDSLEEDTLSEIDIEAFGEFPDKEDTWSEIGPDEFEFEIHSEIDTEEEKDEPIFTGISYISEERGQKLSEWRPYIPPEPVF